VIIEDSVFDISDEEQNHEDLEYSVHTSLDKEAKQFLVSFNRKLHQKTCIHLQE
jgi:hypothetical protein